MLRQISILLIMCLLVPLVPVKAEAQFPFAPAASPSSMPVQVPTQTSVPALPADYIAEGNLPSDYELGPGDQIEVHLIVGQKALALDYNFKVSPEGKIFYPQVGEIYVSGLTLEQFKEKLAQRIRQEYKEGFEISAILQIPKQIKVYVAGEVGRPGPYSVYDGSRVSEVLRVAGGISNSGSTRAIRIKRGKEILVLDLSESFKRGDTSEDVRVKMGDIVEVPQAYIYIYGEVGRSGRFTYNSHQKLSDYINTAGGPTGYANLSGVTVTRQNSGETKVYHIDMAKILYKGIFEKDMELYPGDVINIPRQFLYIADFQGFMSIILTLTALYATFFK